MKPMDTSPRPTPEQLQELRKKAQAATKGNWGYYGSPMQPPFTPDAHGDVGIGSDSHTEPIAVALGIRVRGKCYHDAATNARYIAAANPQTVIGLLDYIEALERENAELMEIRKEWDGHVCFKPSLIKKRPPIKGTLP